MAQSFICIIVLFVIGIFSKKIDDQKHQDFIIPILPESEAGIEDYSEINGSIDFDCEDYDLFDDLEGMTYDKLDVV